MTSKSPTTLVCAVTLIVVGLVTTRAVVVNGQGQRRDAPAAAVAGSGRISGVVLSNESTPRPVRRARVTLQGAPQEQAQVTDDRGVFVFERLSAGTYTLTATKAAYMPAVYGAPQPGRSGTSIVLADKQSIEVSMSMVQGAAVTGIVRDSRGRPMADVDVGVMPIPTPDKPKPSLNPLKSITDDRGVYRMFGVPPGRYYVAAVPMVSFSSGVAGRRTEAEIDAIFAQLQQRVRDVATSIADKKPRDPLPLGSPTAFAAVIHPGVTRIDAATPINLASGEERTGIDFAMTNVRVGAIEGTLSGGVINLDRVELNLMFEGPQLPISSASRPILTQPPDKAGHFRYDNILPGRFSILARALSGEGDPDAAKPLTGSGFASGAGSSFGRSAPKVGGDEFVYGRADVEVDDGATGLVSIAMMPGATMSGVIALDRVTAPAPSDLTQLSVQVLHTESVSINVNNNTAIGNQFMGMSATPFRGDGTWAVRGVAPGKFTLLPILPAAIAKDWWLRSAMLNGRDLLDGPFDVQSGQDVAGITFTFTDRHNELSGTLTTAAGKAASDYFIIVCPAAPKLWTPNSRRVKSLRPSSDGAFSVKDLPAGDYVIAALTDVAPGEWNDPQWLAAVAPAGAKFTIVNGEKTVQNLRLGGS